MANRRNLIVLVVVLAALAVLFSITSRQRSYMDETGGFVDLVEGTLSTEDVYGIDAYLGEDPSAGFSLAKQGDQWVLASHHRAPANLNKIRTLLGNLESLEGEFRSDAAGVLADYGLDDSSAVHLVVRDESGGERVHLLVGKRSGQGGFVRQKDSARVLLGDHNLLSDLAIWGDQLTAPAHTNWLDREAYKVERDQVTAIELRWPDGSLSMEKEFAEPDSTQAEGTPPAYEWRVTEPERFLAQKTRSDAILNSLTSLRARDVVSRGEIPAEYGLDEGAATVTIHRGEETDRVRFGAKLPDESAGVAYYFGVDGQDLVWAMPDYVYNNVFKDPQTLKPE